MNQQNLEHNQFQDQQLHLNQKYIQDIKSPEKNDSFQEHLQNFGMRIENYSQRDILVAIFLFVIIVLSLYSHFGTSNSQSLLQNHFLLTQETINQLLTNSLIQSQFLEKFAQDHNITKQQFQRAIKFSEINAILNNQTQRQSIKVKSLLDKDQQIFTSKFLLNENMQSPLSFCIILPSLQANQKGQYNNVLKSILNQKYQHFKIIFPENSSIDNPYSISSFLKSRNFSQTKSLKITNYNQNILNNIFFGIKQHCYPGEIVFLVSNVESLIGVNVLNIYNTMYKRTKAFTVYSEYLNVDFTNLKAQLGDVKNITKIIQSKIKINDYRLFNEFPIISFYSDIFSSIPISYLTDSNQNFYNEAWDKAFLIPLFQLSDKKTTYLNEITHAVDSSKFNYNLKGTIHYLKDIQLIQKNLQLKPLQNDNFVKSDQTNNNNKNGQNDREKTIDKSDENQKNKASLTQLKKYQTQTQQLYSEKIRKTQETVKQLVGINILQRQNEDNQQLKQAILKDQNQNERNPLKSPVAIRSEQINHDQELLRTPQSKRLELSHQSLHEVPRINQNQHKPQQKSQARQQRSDAVKKSEQVIINGKKSIKSSEVLPIDELGGFLQDQQIVEVDIPKKDTKSNKKTTFIAGRMDVKGSHYNFNATFENMIANADLQKIFGKRKSKQGIWRNQFFQAIQKLQITNNIKYGGEIDIQLSKFDNDKFEKVKRINSLIKTQTQYLEATYKISQFKKKELPFCIVVPSYQNVKTGLYLRNLNSIFMQNYTNYHVVYADDASEDKTGEYVKSYVLSREIPTDKIQIITNKQNRKPPYNIYNAITNHCKLGQLALIVEGDDALIGNNVLSLYNAIYQRDKCAMIYSSYLDIFDNSKVQLGVGHQIMDEYFQKNSIRTVWQIPGKYLLSFYVDIFKSIKVQDFKDPNGYFFWFAYDRAFITPLLQVSYPRITIVKQILYEHRRDSNHKQSINDWNRQSSQILTKKPYKPLKFFPFIQRNKYKYFFDAPIEQVIQNSDFQTFTFENNFQNEGITKDMHIKSIRMTQLIHNVRFSGEIKVELTQFQVLKEVKQDKIRNLLDQDKNYYNQKYDIDQYKKDELPFCILTPSYNNVKSGLYLRNLDSIFMQDYNNYHVVYIDDCSPDKTGQFVKKYLQEKKIPKQKIQVIINKQNKKALSNIHLGIHKYCKSGEIVAIIDGDDSFIGRNILALFNAVYQKENAAMAYSNFLTIHNNDRTQLGFCHQINKDMFEQNTFRNSWDLPGTHLMTFYSDVFKKIKISDLTYPNGMFYDYAYDRAILTPLLEMSYPRISVIKQITYQYRNDTGINDSPDDWTRVSHIILDKKPYNHLAQFPFIQGLIISTDKFNFKTSIQTVIKNTDFSAYDQQSNRKISGIAKEQHIHAIRLTQLVHNINFQGNVEISLKSTKTPEKKRQRLQKLLKSDKQYLQAKYQISKYKSRQVPFCIVVSSFGNVQNGLYLRNLDSILMQDYKNYKVIYIDDNSPDQGHQYVKKYLQQKQIPQNVAKMIVNKQTRKQLANIFYAAHNECRLNQIMLVISGNDALIGRNVLNILNALYQKQNSQVGYSCFLKVFNTSTQLGSCDQIQDFYFTTNTFRNKNQFQKYRLITFYTHLFRRIKISDLTHQNGTFFNYAIDKAIMTPLIEMVHPNVLVAKQIMYEQRNDQTLQDSALQLAVTNIILSKRSYASLERSSFDAYS